MPIKLKCDKCKTDLGDVEVRSFCEMTDPGGGSLLSFVVTKPATSARVRDMPKGARRLLCDACDAALDAALAAFSA